MGLPSGYVRELEVMAIAERGLGRRTKGDVAAVVLKECHVRERELGRRFRGRRRCLACGERNADQEK